MKTRWGAIFDWDGVIIDSSKHHEESWELLAKENKFSLPPDHFKKGFGMKNEEIIPNLLQWTSDVEKIKEFSLRKEELYRQVVARRGISPLPGVREFLAHLHQKGVPCVIGSSTHRLNIVMILERFGFKDYFKDMVTAEDVTLGKPDPQVFLMASKKLMVPPARCIVFEDALVGIQSARAAGMRVVGVASTHEAEKLTGVDVVVRRLDELSAEMLGKWVGSEN